MLNLYHRNEKEHFQTSTSNSNSNAEPNNNQVDFIKRIPGPLSFPIFGSSWLYSWLGPYKHEAYHLSNFDKFAKYGPVVREEVLWNYPLIHLFDAADIDKVLRYKSDTPYRPHNEADVFYRRYRNDLYANIGMVNENGEAWKILRKHLSPPLTNRKTPFHYASNMNQIADELVGLMELEADRNQGNLLGNIARGSFANAIVG